MPSTPSGHAIGMGVREPIAWCDVRFLLVWALPLCAVWDLLNDPIQLVWHVLGLYLLVLLADALLPASLAPVVRSRRGASWFCSTILRLYVPIQLGLQVLGVWAAWQLGWAEGIMVAAAIGLLVGALGVPVAHELGHSVKRYDRVLAWVLMTSIGYAHFMIEHYRGHHPRAATSRDPASARFGESLWQFLPRAIRFGVVHAWKLEARHLFQGQKSWGNSPLVWALLVNLLSMLATVVCMVPQVLVFIVTQALVAVLLLECVNYIGHYGLERLQPDFRIETFKPCHAWSANKSFSNALLLNLQHHADHHVSPWKSFRALTPIQGSPELPAGYAGSILLAAVPTLWFNVMHPKLEKIKRERALTYIPTRPAPLL
jgi:alkane 1-monooxygenase